MKAAILFIGVFITGFSYAQNNPRLYISFESTESTEPVDYYKEISPEFSEICQQYHLQLTPAFKGKEAFIDQLANNARTISGNDRAANRLRYLYKVAVSVNSETELNKLMQELDNLPFVRYTARMASIPIAPPGDILPVTPNYESMQGFIGPDPGVNMEYAWNQGITGAGIYVRDLEYGVNLNHEELNEQNIYVGNGLTINPILTTDYTEHGTAAIGVLAANRGTYGSSGLVHGVNEVVLFPEFTIEYDYNRVEAVSQAIAASNPGDVIMYEMQTEGANLADFDYVPAEYDYPVWELTKAATDAGIVIVAAAGNGNQDLDDPLYQDYLLRENSGAIIVGAGSPDTSHDRLSFSSYGSRVDVQGWGSDVFSPGYGNAFIIGGDFNQQYTYFSGTSSATPIVTSCAVALQSFYHNTTGNYLTGPQIRDILIQTGIPQGNGVNGHIGPLPNMQAALDFLSANA